MTDLTRQLRIDRELRAIDEDLLHRAGEIGELAHRALVQCPSCGGWPELDETGRPYTCFRCCDTGWITKAAYEEEARHEAAYEAERAAAEAARRQALGVPEGYGYYIDEYDGDVVLIPPRGTTPVVGFGDDDIPF